MKFIKRLFSKLASPFALGIYTTLIVTFTSFYYYNARSSGGEIKNPLFSFLELVHQNSYDLRLRSRGPQKGDPRVALLAVDEKSVNSVARWPWPREIIAKALDQVIELGGKVISFDVVFSEPSANPSKSIYQQLKRSTNLPENVDQVFQKELSKVDSDKILSDVILKRQDNFVLGSFFDGDAKLNSDYAYLNSCHHLIYEQSPAFNVWDNEESIISPIDAYEFYFSDLLADVYKNELLSIEDEIKESSKKPKNKLEQVALENQIMEAKYNYCNNWLAPDIDPKYEIMANNWGLIRSEDEDIQEKSFDEWVQKIKNPHIYLNNPIPFVTRWVTSIPMLAKNTKHTGFFNANLDSDGTIRRTKLVTRSGNAYMPSIALKAYLLANNYNAAIHFEVDEKQSFKSKKVSQFNIVDNETGNVMFQVPTDSEGRMLINYAGSEKMFPHVSLAEFLSDDPEMKITQRQFDKTLNAWSEPKVQTVNKKSFLKDKIFIFGATAIGIYDLRVTPFEENFPGAETHVNVIDNLLRRDFLRVSNDEAPTMIVVLSIFGIIFSFLISQLGAISAFLSTFLTIAATLYVDKVYFFEKGIVTTIFLPLFLILTIYVILTFYKYFTEERKKKELKGTFSKYVSPAIVDEVLKDPENLELGGRKQRMTVFFSDIRGFTTISEALDPAALTQLLNRYLTPMTEIVFDNKGTLDKYMGDAIMAFFGAPISYETHAQSACRCALKSLEKLKELQEEFKAQGLPDIDIGIGLNTGEMNVGNMGSETVRNYTVMGDAVNLGSRLEGINKQYGTRIIISEFTYNDIKDHFICREVDWVRVKGKNEPVRIFELISESQLEDNHQKMIDHFKKGFDLYHEKEFQKALDEFKNGHNIKKDDKLCQLYIERCENYLKTPPPNDWDGVFIMTSK